MTFHKFKFPRKCCFDKHNAKMSEFNSDQDKYNWLILLVSRKF